MAMKMEKMTLESMFWLEFERNGVLEVFEPRPMAFISVHQSLARRILVIKELSVVHGRFGHCRKQVGNTIHNPLTQRVHFVVYLIRFRRA